MDGKTAFATILQREGVDVVFCFPNNILIDACAAAGIRPHHLPHGAHRRQHGRRL